MKCPTCFMTLAASPVTFVCTGSCAPKRNATASGLRGYDVDLKPMFDQPVEALQAERYPSCPQCQTESHTEVCRHCGDEIPMFWRGSQVTCIAMAGARATGKSLTLAVAKEQLALLVERHHRSMLKPLADTEAFFQQHYASALYEKRELLMPSASYRDGLSNTRRSMIFRFSERRSDGSSVSRILVLRDVAGEDLEALDEADRQLAFFSRADAVIAMIDPLAVRQIRSMLIDLLPVDTRVSDGDGQVVLQYILDLMTNHRPHTRTSIPLAVVLSKFDVLQVLRRVEATDWQSIMNRPGSPLQRDPSLDAGHYDEDDGALLDAEVRGLLSRLNANQLTAILDERADRYRFFAVSALGASPEGDAIDAGGIAPFRVLDPIKWALAVAG